LGICSSGEIKGSDVVPGTTLDEDNASTDPSFPARLDQFAIDGAPSGASRKSSRATDVKYALVLAACVCTPCAAQEASVDDLLAQADPAIQAQIKATSRAFLTGGRSESDFRTNWRAFRELSTLKGLANDEEQLVKQLAIYAVVEPGIEETQVLEALHILQMLNLKAGIPIRVLVPYLDSDNEVLRGFVRDWFESPDGRRASRSTRELDASYKDYWDYINRMLGSNEEVPTAFVEYMYERSPGQALLVFLRLDGRDEVIAHLRAIRENLDAAREGRAPIPFPKPKPQDEQREIRLAVTLIDNAIWFKENQYDQRWQAALPEVNELLAKLSEHDQWWVRLYVAAMMRRHRELRIADVLERLSDDENESVRKATPAVRP
jgi:hypothetical protein